MQEIIESFFRERSLVNHQLASYNDCIPVGDGRESRMESIVRNIRIGSDEPVEDDEGGMVKLDLLDGGRGGSCGHSGARSPAKAGPSAWV